MISTDTRRILYHVIADVKAGKGGVRFSYNTPLTPYELTQEIIKHMDGHVDLRNGRILVLFTVEFAIALREMGCENVTLVTDAYCMPSQRICNRIGVEYKRLEEVVSEKKPFDVILGNPPFQKENAKAKRWTQWIEFVKKANELGNYICLVTPQSITSQGAFEHIRQRLITINMDVSKHFNVGSTFAYYIVGPKDEADPAEIITENGKFFCDVSAARFLPAIINDQSLTQLEALEKRKSRVWKRGELHTSRKEIFSDSGKYEVIHTNAQTLKTNIEHPNREKIRVCVTLSGYPIFRVVQGAYCSQATMWTEFDNQLSAEKFAEECNSTEVQEIMKNFKWSGWNSKEVIECL